MSFRLRLSLSNAMESSPSVCASEHFLEIIH